MLTQEQAQRIAREAQARGLSRDQTRALLVRANERATTTQQALQPQETQQPVEQQTTAPDIAPPERPLAARIADGVDTAQAGLNAFTNTLTFGSLDRLNAGVDRLLNDGPGTVAGNRQQRQALAQANPGATALGTVAGIALPAIASGGASTGAQAAARGTGAVANAANTVRNAAQAGVNALPQALTNTASRRVATTTALQGAAFDPSSDENTDFFQPGQRLQNAALGLAGGQVLSAGGRALGGLKDRAGELAAQFIKPTARQAQELAARFGTAAEFGRQLLDADAFKGVLTGGRKRVLKNLSDLATARGKAIPETLNKIANEAKKAGLPAKETSVNVRKILKETRDRFRNTSTLDRAGANKRLDKIIDNLSDSAGLRNRKSLVPANELRKSNAQELFRRKGVTGNLTEKEEVQRFFTNRLKQEVDSVADKAAEKVLGASAKNFSRAKKDFSVVEESRKVLDNRLQKETGLNRFGLRQSAATGVGGLIAANELRQGDVGGAARAGLGTLAVNALLSPNSAGARAQLFNALGNSRLVQGLQGSTAATALNRLLLPDN